MQETVLSNVRDANGAWPGAGPASARFKVSTCHVCDELTFKEFRYLGIGNPYATPLPSNRALPMRQIRLIATATNSISTLFWLLGVGLCGFVLFAASQFVSLASPWNGVFDIGLLAVVIALLGEVAEWAISRFQSRHLPTQPARDPTRRE